MSSTPIEIPVAIRRVRFNPLPGVSFRLTMWETREKSLLGGNTISYRLMMHVTGHPAVELFNGTQFSVLKHTTESDEALSLLMFYLVFAKEANPATAKHHQEFVEKYAVTLWSEVEDRFGGLP